MLGTLEQISEYTLFSLIRSEKTGHVLNDGSVTKLGEVSTGLLTSRFYFHRPKANSDTIHKHYNSYIHLQKYIQFIIKLNNISKYNTIIQRSPW